MDRLRRLSWYERIKSDPSPEDDALLQVTRELAVQLDSQFWYRQILWGKFHREGVSWLISKPVISRELWLGPLSVPPTDLMLPEYLKGKLVIDEWRPLIAMHLTRVKAYSSGQMTRILGAMVLGILAVFGALLLFLPVFLGRPWGPILVFPAWSPALLLALLWVRRKMRRWEFELDKQVAVKLGPEQVLHVLEKMQSLQPETKPSMTNLVHRLTDYWTTSSSERIEKLKHPELVTLPTPSRIPKIGLRGRVMIALVGVAIYLTPGFVAARLFFGQGQIPVSCVDQTCIALVMTSFVGFVLIILGTITTVLAVVHRVRQARWKKKYLA